MTVIAAKSVTLMLITCRQLIRFFQAKTLRRAEGLPAAAPSFAMRASTSERIFNRSAFPYAHRSVDW